MVTLTDPSTVWDCEQLQTEMPKHVLTGFMRYGDFRSIGRGGKAEVFRCRDTTLGRDVALKVLHHSLMGSPIEQRMLTREARIMASMDNSSIPAVHDLGRDTHGRPYFAMEFIEGRTLRDLLELTVEPDSVQPDVPSTEELVGYVLGAGEALQHIHQQGVVHGDLKPENLVIGRDNKVRIIDWGLATISAGDYEERLETQWGRQGSPLYMSPEQVACEQTLQPATDIYSLGVVLYECLTGRSPLKGATSRETLDLVASTEPDPPTSVAPERHIPDMLDQACVRALEKHPADRFTSMAEFCDSLREGHLEQLMCFERTW